MGKKAVNSGRTLWVCLLHRQYITAVPVHSWGHNHFRKLSCAVNPQLPNFITGGELKQLLSDASQNIPWRGCLAWCSFREWQTEPRSQSSHALPSSQRFQWLAEGLLWQPETLKWHPGFKANEQLYFTLVVLAGNGLHWIRTQFLRSSTFRWHISMRYKGETGQHWNS